MKQIILTTLCGLFILLLNSCSSDVLLENYLDFNAPFILTITPTDTIVSLSDIESEVIEVNSVKWNKLIEWGENNKTGWHSSPASFMINVCVSQGDFKLLHTRDSKGVVIIINDTEGNSMQYAKGIKPRELDFLFD